MDIKKIHSFILVNIEPCIDIAFEYLDNLNFLEEFDKNTEKSVRIASSLSNHLPVNWRSFTNSKKIINENSFIGFRTYNLCILYLFKFYMKSPITTFITSKKIQNSRTFQVINYALDISLKGISTEEYALNFFPALKWFYSEKTKHLYSKELLGEMREYEKKIKNIKWEDCIEKPSKFFKFSR